MSADTPLAKADHVAEPSVKEWGGSLCLPRSAHMHMVQGTATGKAVGSGPLLQSSTSTLLSRSSLAAASRPRGSHLLALRWPENTVITCSFDGHRPTMWPEGLGIS